MTFNGTTYFYVLNLQGDVIWLVDASGAVKATYTYDAWGNAVVSSGALVNVNPLRYRGYYYDFQTQMYYLNSRYFDPANRRFISADGCIFTSSEIAGYNMFSYCYNNPLNWIDPNGHTALPVLFFGDVLAALESILLGLSAFLASVLLYNSLEDSLFSSSPAIPLTPNVGLPSNSDEKAKEKTFTPIRPQMFFPANPDNFTPRGLIPNRYVENGAGSNGGIIKWEIPFSKTAIFEWDGGINDSIGSHYHVMLPEWRNKHQGPHFVPGTPVPEPWNTMYFG